MFDELVSVVMSVYNTDVRLLQIAINSILNQTYSNFEFIIINDGSTNDCKDYLRNLSDKRIRLIENNKNIGLAASLNKGIEISRGKYIFRMDADDISLKDRFYHQIKFMERHEDIDILSSQVATFEDGRITGTGGVYWNFDPEEFKIKLSLGPMSFPHPAVVFRKNFLDKTGLRYDESYLRAQDYNMWVRCSEYGKLYVFPKVLLIYREDTKNTNNIQTQNDYSNKTKIISFKRLIDKDLHKHLEQYIHLKDKKIFGTAEENIVLINELCKSNRKKKKYDIKKYENIIFFWIARKSIYKNNKNKKTGFWNRKAFRKRMIKASINEIGKYLIQYAYQEWCKIRFVLFLNKMIREYNVK